MVHFSSVTARRIHSGFTPRSSCVHLGVENLHKVGAIGVPGCHWEAKIVDEQGQETPQGGIGELAVKGPGVMLCYYKNPEATAEILKDGWLCHTGGQGTPASIV